MIMVKAGKIATYGHANPWTDFFTMQVAKLLPASVVLVSVMAFVKLMSAMVWLYIVGRNITWGVAWHRFSAFFNIYFKREDDGTVALGAAKPMMSKGQSPDDGQRRPRHRHSRRRKHRRLLLEGLARLHHLHRVRALPVPVPRVEHRKAALPQAAHHVAA